MHPPLTDFPIALMPLAVLWGIVGVWQGGDFWWRAAFWTLVAGLVAAVPTAITGLIDYLRIARNSRAFNTATTHMLVMLTGVTVFASSAIVQGGPSAVSGGRAVLVIALGVFGTLLLAAGGWLGGELVYGEGVGVRSRAKE